MLYFHGDNFTEPLYSIKIFVEKIFPHFDQISNKSIIDKESWPILYYFCWVLSDFSYLFLYGREVALHSDLFI